MMAHLLRLRSVSSRADILRLKTVTFLRSTLKSFQHSISGSSVASSPTDEDLETDHMDAVKAFTHSDVDADIVVDMAEGFSVRRFVLKLR